MVRRAYWPALALVASLGAGVVGAQEPSADDPRTALEFIQGLRDRRYHDLAVEAVERLRGQADLPPEIKSVLDYELGRTLLDEASSAADLEQRSKLLDQARGRLDAFTKAEPNHPKASEALVQLARLLVERGHLSVLLGEDSGTPAAKEAKLAEARGSFVQARATYDAANKILGAAYATFPKFLPAGDARIKARDLALNAMIQGQLQRALVDYEEAQTYPPKDKRRDDLMEKSRVAFEAIYKDHRTELAGLYARMWQGKCYEERGDLGEAMGVYNELMQHDDPLLKPLQRQVGYFRILVMAKRNEHALAADEAVRWLQAYPTERRSPEGIGVQLAKARSIAAQLPDLKESDREAATKLVVEALTEVVRYASPHKAEAVELLKKYRTQPNLTPAAVAGLSYEAAMGAAEEALASQDYDRASTLLRAAIRKADPAKQPDLANRARYLLAFAAYQSKHYYESFLLADHLARRYPKFDLSAKATEIGMAALRAAYNTYNQVDRASDLDRLVEFAAYTAETWPDVDQGDNGRMALGEVHLSRGKYPDAAAAFESVRKDSSRWPEAQSSAGDAHWKQALTIRAKGDPTSTAANPDVDAESKKAVDALLASLAARKTAGVPVTDAGFLETACVLGDVYLGTDRAKEAVELLQPLAAALATPAADDKPAEADASRAKVLALTMRAYIALGQLERALVLLKPLESASAGGASITQFYFRLGQLLQKEMLAQERKNDAMGLKRTRDAYQRMLDALLASKAGQSYDSLQWAGDAMLSIDRPKEASAIFDRILKTYEADPAFKARPGFEKLLLRTKLRQSEALRGQKDFDGAAAGVAALIKQNPRALEPRIEQARLLEDRALAGKGSWDKALTAWQILGAQLRSATPKPAEYFDVWYHVAFVLWKKDDKAKAVQTLKAIMRTSPTLGSPEMKTRYDELLRQIGN
ncbi:tetratricopeptide repeat protein [Isosphaeraceae bacterium EP7]